MTQTNPTIKEMFHFVFRNVLKKRWILGLNILALTVITLLQFVLPQIEQFIIDKVIPQAHFKLLLISIGLLLLTAIVLGVFNFISTYYMGVMSQTAITDLRTQLYNDILHQDTHFFESSKTGDLMVRLTSDINNMQSLISANMLAMIGNLFTFIGVLGFIFYKNWQMALAVSLTFPLTFFIYRYFRDRIHAAFIRVRQSQSQMSNQMQNTLTQIDLIKSYTSEDSEATTFGKYADQNKMNMINATKNQAIFSPLVDGVNYLGVAIVLLLGAYFVIKHQLTVGGLVAYLSYVSMLQNPISSFTRLLNQLQQSLVSYSRIKAVTQVKPKIIDAKTAVAMPQLKQGITLDHVYFTFKADDPTEKTKHAALTDVSFKIPYGQQTALVGHSGAGKSTITKLIDRLYDIDQGQIYFDNLPITQIQLQSLRQNIAIVSQDIAIIDGTIRDNIRYGTQDATDAQIWQMAELADIKTFIAGLPNQLDTQVGERGIKLSGGQRQRLAIARALLKDAQIVILDEATANLDNESEKTIQNALNNLMQSRTSLVIAHRLSTIHNADQIVVLDDGQVVETGTHQSLLAQGGAYAKLYQAQFE
ncbi:ABC transporter ATP-binding protein [Agrilactobacillus fermenti]|uniref:ABC transporter ATP-binding protein n=1 Tax=Agrilactobacillus fermenti TaxID=2586909 RepID=UPI003A5C2B56